MIELPASTVFNRRVPKQRFYDNLSVNAKLKRAFTDQIAQIVWRNKISASTTNLKAGERVQEIEVIAIKLNQHDLDTKVLEQIDKEIPYHILFLLEQGDEVQAWISYKEASQTKPGTFKPGVYYHTDWMDEGSLSLKLSGLDMDTAYESFIRQIAGERLEGDVRATGYDVKEAIDRDLQRQKLQCEIAALEKKIQTEKQFNRQVELNEELKRLQAVEGGKEGE